MAYEKVTPQLFKKNLKAGEYAGAVGAKRALGKVKGWTEADKADAIRAVNRHFGIPVGKAQGNGRKSVSRKAN